MAGERIGRMTEETMRQTQKKRWRGRKKKCIEKKKNESGTRRDEEDRLRK